MSKLTDAQLRAMGHDPSSCECDLCCPPNTDPAAQSQRVRQLDRMTKSALLRIMTKHVLASGAHYVIGGPRVWSKDELISGILAAEFPQPERDSR